MLKGRIVRLYVIAKTKGFHTRQGLAAWRLYNAYRKRMGLGWLDVPAELQTRWYRNEWPFDGTVRNSNRII